MFKLVSNYAPAGDQPHAIDQMIQNIQNGDEASTLLGVTGSGKTFALANAISKLNRPVLVLSHNKTLAVQLHSEFKAFFPENAVEFFISYYDYYLPESYIPQTDTYIAKDAAVNENIEQLRLSASASLLERRDVIIVASVSCIYGLGSPEDYTHMCLPLKKGDKISRRELLTHLIASQYDRNDIAPSRGEFRVRGDIVDIFEPHRAGFIRVEFWGDSIERIQRCDDVTGKPFQDPPCVVIFPCKHFVLPQEKLDAAAVRIRGELKERLDIFRSENKLLEAQRLEQRTNYDLDMMKEMGYCTGIENYSRHLSERPPGARPFCLLDFFPKDFITIIDESHVTIPQINAMYKADRSRKETLVDHGFRLPSALDNRPLKFDEFNAITGQKIFVSATPAKYELEHSGDPIEMVVRPTGLLDPLIEVRPLEGQIDDAMDEIKEEAMRGQRTLVTTLTKKSAERLADYLTDLKIRVRYLHSEIDALERARILTELRRGDFDCLIGINLLREGIDLPEVGLVCILDADKEGFLRSERSLIQVAGRAARNANGRVILYADKITDAIKKLADVTRARRKKQIAYNEAHGIVPQTIVKEVRESVGEYFVGSPKHKKKGKNEPHFSELFEKDPVHIDEKEQLVIDLEREMLEAAEQLEFERAAFLRDKIRQLQSPTLETPKSHSKKKK